MDYEKKYKEALERAEEIIRYYKEHNRGDETSIEDLETVFPELKESEDEKIRKELIRETKGSEERLFEVITNEEFIAWLERQCKQEEPQVYETENGEVITYSESDGYNVVEPKFKVGDWVVYECGEDSGTLQIKNIVYGTYEFTDDSTLNVVDEDILRLWTIADAKDGDVLHSPEHKLLWIYKNKEEYHAAINLSYANFVSFGADIVMPSDVHPATKEQRDLLFQKMKEAGYQWDVEKKELKKIEQKSANSVKTEFKVGDWIVGTLGGYYKVLAIEQEYSTGKYDYILLEPSGNETSYGKEFVDEHFHRWTIQDAKDGDVLHSIGFHNDCIFIFNGLDNDEPNGYREVATGYCCLFISADKMEFGIQGPDGIEIDTVKPATKIQRDLLFQKMEEAGYEWDAEKKELKKIEDEIEIPFGAKDSELIEEEYYIPKGFHAEIDDDKVVIKKGEKPATWSDEDKDMVRYIGNAITCEESAKYLEEKGIDMIKAHRWLDSLKPQSKEWSEEDEFRFNRTIENIELLNDANGGILFKDIEWLNSIKNKLSKVKKC